MAAGKKYVEIVNVEAVGNYALMFSSPPASPSSISFFLIIFQFVTIFRITFDDFHDTGFFSWSFLRDLGDNRIRFGKRERVVQEKTRERNGNKNLIFYHFPLISIDSNYRKYIKELKDNNQNRTPEKILKRHLNKTFSPNTKKE